MKHATRLTSMSFLILALLILTSFNSIDLSEFLKPISENAHIFCLELSPDSPFSMYYKGIVCGQRLNESSAYYLRQTGLYHIMVVSGAHLLFLQQILDFFSKLSKVNISQFKLLVLTGFAFLTNLGAPVLRALNQIFTSKLNERFKIGLSHPGCVFFSGLLTLTLFPSLFSSLSLQLSWLASLALGVNLPSGRKQLLLFTLLLPIIASMNAPNPIAILSNLIMAPFLGLILFPLSLFSFLMPLHLITDWVWAIFLFINKFIAIHTEPLALSTEAINETWIWAYIGILHLILALNQRLRII